MAANFELATKEKYRFPFKGMIGVEDLWDLDVNQLDSVFKALNKEKGPMIIISADGMCEAGRILYHLANNVSNPNNIILIVGYMAENTLGRKLRDGEKEVNILGDTYHVKAQVETINAFSAHADYREMTDWLDNIDTSRLKKIFLIHGEKDAQAFFKDHLAQNGYKDVDIIRYGESYELK